MVFAHAKHSASIGWLLGCCLVGVYHVSKRFQLGLHDIRKNYIKSDDFKILCSRFAVRFCSFAQFCQKFTSSRHMKNGSSMRFVDACQAGSVEFLFVH